MQIRESDTIRGLYGAEPRVESLTVLRNELYRRVETDVRDWVYEQRFVPRFLLSAAAFVVVYLFLSLVIRDPIPLVDELLIALVAGGGAFFLLGRRYEQSKGAAERRAELRSKIDSITFEESSFVHTLETVLHRFEERSPEALFEADDLAEELSAITEDHREEAVLFLEVLQQMLTGRSRKAVAEVRRRAPSARTVRTAERGDIDLPLAALAAYLERSLV